MHERSIPHRFAIVALVIGAIGASGQAYLLYHELADCLPYKVLDFDYRSIARIGVWMAPLAAILAASLFVRKQFWLPLVVPVVFTPLLFAAIYKAFSVAHGLDTIVEAQPIGDFTFARAAEQFYSYSLGLAATGLVVAAISSLLLWLLRPRHRLA